MRVASLLCQSESFKDYHLGEGNFSVTFFGTFSVRQFDRLGFFENIFIELNIFVIVRGREMVGKHRVGNQIGEDGFALAFIGDANFAENLGIYKADSIY
jgi:hypothetical protein